MEIPYESFIEACKQQDLKSVQQYIDNGFPVYLCQQQLLDLIVVHDLRHLYPMIIKHITEHHFNTNIINNQFIHDDNTNLITSYELYILITTETSDQTTLVTDFLKSTNAKCIATEIILKLLDYPIPTDILKILCNWFIPSLKHDDLEQKDILLNHIYYQNVGFCFNQNAVTIFETLFTDTQDYVIKHLFDSEITLKWLHYSIKEYADVSTIKKYNLIPDYSIICSRYNFDDAVDVLSRLICKSTNTQILNFKEKLLELKIPKVIRTVKKMLIEADRFNVTAEYFYTALENSYWAKNEQLITFNLKILQTCFQQDTKQFENEHIHLTKANLEKKIDDAVFGMNVNQSIIKMKKILEYMNKENIELKRDIWRGYRYLGYEMYLSYWGYRDLLATIKLDSDHDQKTLRQYLDEENKKLYSIILSSDILVLNMRKLIYEYMRY